MESSRLFISNNISKLQNYGYFPGAPCLDITRGGHDISRRVHMKSHLTKKNVSMMHFLIADQKILKKIVKK